MEHWSETKEKLWRHYMHISSMKKWTNWTGSGNKLETCSGLSRHFVTDWKLELVQLCNSFSGAVLKRDLQICVLEPSDKHLYPDWYMRTRTLHSFCSGVFYICSDSYCVCGRLRPVKCSLLFLLHLMSSTLQPNSKEVKGATWRIGRLFQSRITGVTANWILFSHPWQSCCVLHVSRSKCGLYPDLVFWISSGFHVWKRLEDRRQYSGFLSIQVQMNHLVSFYNEVVKQD